MPHFPKPFYRKSPREWYVWIRGRQINLDPSAAFQEYHRPMAAPTTPVTADLAVAVIDQFLDRIQRRKAPRTCEWNKRRLQDLALSTPAGSNLSGRNPLSTIEKPLTREEADSKEVARLVVEGKRVADPELRRRIRERSEAVQRQIFEKHGVVEWAVDMIRDIRDGDEREQFSTLPWP